MNLREKVTWLVVLTRVTSCSQVLAAFLSRLVIHDIHSE